MRRNLGMCVWRDSKDRLALQGVECDHAFSRRQKHSRRPLRMRAERPFGQTAAKKRDEIPPPRMLTPEIKDRRQVWQISSGSGPCIATRSRLTSEFWSKRGRQSPPRQCLLSGQRPSRMPRPDMSASCQLRTHAVQQTANYSITSSAIATSFSGSVRPRNLAILPLITS